MSAPGFVKLVKAKEISEVADVIREQRSLPLLNAYTTAWRNRYGDLVIRKSLSDVRSREIKTVALHGTIAGDRLFENNLTAFVDKTGNVWIMEEQYERAFL